jgi:hypothetical protein
MKQATALLLCLIPMIFVAGCNGHDLHQKYTPSLDAFVVRSICPEICWLGIHPGLTTVDDALVLLNSTDEIDQASIQEGNGKIQAVWFTEDTRTFRSYITISTYDNLIVSISMRELAPFVLSDIVALFGEPDDISISFWTDRNDAQYSVYAVYYNTLASMFYVASGSEDGPNPNDTLDWVTFNGIRDDNYHQPWLGYGHLSEYLPRAVPTVISPIFP